jgi:protease YdgD
MLKLQLRLMRATSVNVVFLALMLTASMPGRAFSREAISVDTNAYPWSSVGKIYNSARSACTGAVVAAEKVITAAHCLFNHATQRFLQASSLHFLLGYEAGDYRAHVRAASYVTGPDYDPQQTNRSFASDWAILSLTEPLAKENIPLALAASPPVVGDRLMIGGFSQQHPFKMTADTDCQLLQVLPGGLLAHDCAVMQGDSGAPVLKRNVAGEIEVVGVAVALAKGGPRLGLAAPISSIASQLSPRGH